LADVTIVSRQAAAAPTATPAALPELGMPVQLRIEVPRPIHIAGDELELRARGSITLDAEGDEISASGRVEAMPGGRLTLFDRRYDIERGVLIFKGHDVDVDLAVTREIGDVALTLELSGPLTDPRVHLTSDPPVYDENQIGGLVAAGDARAAGVSSGQIGGRMVGVITGLMVAGVRERAALPLDVVKLEPGATAASPSRLEIGKFVLGDRLYVSYAYQFGGLTLPTRRLNAHQAQVQLKLVRRLSLDARYGDAGAGALDLTFTLRR
jgi:autotransporter translocation and assembly factor TamB